MPAGSATRRRGRPAACPSRAPCTPSCRTADPSRSRGSSSGGGLPSTPGSLRSGARSSLRPLLSPRRLQGQQEAGSRELRAAQALTGERPGFGERPSELVPAGAAVSGFGAAADAAALALGAPAADGAEALPAPFVAFGPFAPVAPSVAFVPSSARTRPSSSFARSGLSTRNWRDFSRPWPRRISPSLGVLIENHVPDLSTTFFSTPRSSRSPS